MGKLTAVAIRAALSNPALSNPQLESLLRNRRVELGLDAVRGRSLLQTVSAPRVIAGLGCKQPRYHDRISTNGTRAEPVAGRSRRPCACSRIDRRLHHSASGRLDGA